MSALCGLPWFCQTEVTLLAFEPLPKVVVLLIRFLVAERPRGACHQPFHRVLLALWALVSAWRILPQIVSLFVSVRGLKHRGTCCLLTASLVH
jgi:hypothetical protein